VPVVDRRDGQGVGVGDRHAGTLRAASAALASAPTSREIDVPATAWTTFISVELTLCVLLWANEGQEELLAEYEDRALQLVVVHGGQVLSRMRSVAAPASPAEVQVLRFPGEVAFQAFMDDPSRLELSELRDRAVARTEVIPVETIS
jgi:uncharacterized protein (DUF1330 family)